MRHIHIPAWSGPGRGRHSSCRSVDSGRGFHTESKVGISSFTDEVYVRPPS